tara:strand:+ start:83 stop:238 length:156 start_codon:yes stop_codon:yes gene_type:complete
MIQLSSRRSKPIYSTLKTKDNHRSSMPKLAKQLINSGTIQKSKLMETKDRK